MKRREKALRLIEVQVSGRKLIGLRVSELQKSLGTIIYYIDKMGMTFSWERRKPHPKQIVREGDYLGISSDPQTIQRLTMANN